MSIMLLLVIIPVFSIPIRFENVPLFVIVPIFVIIKPVTVI